MCQPLLSQSVPDELVYDILTRLTVKSLIRFSSVCKSWNSTITSLNFIKAHLDRAKSLSNNNNNNGYLLYKSQVENHSLFAMVYNSNRTLTPIARFQNPFPEGWIVGFLYLWNPSIRKFKRILPSYFTDPFHTEAFGLAYHYQNNDYKILKLIYEYSPGEKVPPAEAKVYTLSTDSWRRFVISVEYSKDSRCLFFNGALHSIACLAVFKGSLALIVFTEALADKSKICHIWVMKEYGAVKSWTKKSVLMKDAARFFDCTVNGELLICKFRPFQRLSFDPESLNEEILRIPNAGSMIYTANFVDSLVLLDGINISSKYRN
ncbi:hypothetical protein RGQ29_024567 [Quercus rubra]|uniref:F-box domain-containing protein n=1 Tax=Quercus rubra TaxID=3512 RepID=A0AAN7INN5_QUERU|nr:hypothetical protein RGQ29_024567 [Quercus rubra]